MFLFIISCINDLFNSMMFKSIVTMLAFVYPETLEAFCGSLCCGKGQGPFS